MTWFDSFREDGWNTYYPENRSSAIYDPDEVLIVFFGAVLGLVVLVIFIGSKGPEVSWYLPNPLTAGAAYIRVFIFY